MSTATSVQVDATEVVIVAAVLVVPFLFALALPRFVDTATGGGVGVAVIAAVTAMEVPLTALAVWAVHRRGDDLASIGILRPSPLWLAAGVVVLAAALWLTWQRHTGAWSGAVSASGAGGGDYTTAQRLALMGLGIPQIYLQELLYRGFAITFLERLTGSVMAAIILSSAAFSLAHITSLGGDLVVSLISIFVVSLILSGLYVATRDLTPVFMIHWAWVIWLAVGLSGHAPQARPQTAPASEAPTAWHTWRSGPVRSR